MPFIPVTREVVEGSFWHIDSCLTYKLLVFADGGGCWRGRMTETGEEQNRVNIKYCMIDGHLELFFIAVELAAYLSG